ncbi:unnamed protein product [Parajaminaea phylloscopi]
MAPARRLHRSAGPTHLSPHRPQSEGSEEGGGPHDDSDPLLVPSDVRRRLAASRTVGAFEKLRRAEVAKTRLAQDKAESQRRSAAAERLRREALRSRVRVKPEPGTESRAEVIEIEDDEPRPPRSSESYAAAAGATGDRLSPSARRVVITIKDEDEDEVKFSTMRDAVAGHPSSGDFVAAPDGGSLHETALPPRTPSPVIAQPLDVSRFGAVEDRPSASCAPIADARPETPETAHGLEDIEASEKPWPVPSREEMPWPEPFDRLEEVFKALNTVYSFCSARKHLATTFETLRSSVEVLTGRELEVIHVAQLKSLLPELISFAYVDADALEVNLDANASDAQRKAAFNRSEQDRAFEEAAQRIQQEEEEEQRIFLDGPAVQSAAEQLSSVAALQESSKAAQHSSRRRQDGYVLLFEFNDGTLQGPKATARGQRRAGMRRGPNRQGQDQVKRAPKSIHALPSTASMKRLIDKRNDKFQQAVCELLAACHAKGEDAVDLLLSAANDHVPLDPETAERPTGETPRKKRIRLEYLMNHPDERPEISEVIEELEGQKWWCDQVVPGGRRTIPQRSARYDGLTFVLSQELVNALWETRKIEEFYLHQSEALNALDEGSNVIVSTSTSSGKSLIYQLPIIRELEADTRATAMFIFPTKALAQDQKRSLQDLIRSHALLDETEVIVATYDGDTDRTLRSDIRDRANIIFTNPDMLHQAILPNEHHWRRYLRELRFVVVDELHSYNGLFGAHVSLIMRRLRRMCHALGNRRVQFISCSATVANPKEHMQTLFGIEDVEVVTEDGSPCGKKEWLIWNPPLIDEKDPKQGRVSAYAEVSKIFRHLVERGVRTIVFTKVRRTCEIVISQIRKDLLLEGRNDVVERVMSYRSGYSAEDRRKIEQDMWKGDLLGIVATSALELGIDIGSLDAVIMLGFPYSISSLRQQSGRAGRRLKDSLTVLCCDPFPMDQHYARYPEDVFNQPEAALSVDLGNDFVLEAHLQCAAAEMPIHPGDDAKFFPGDHLADLCRRRLVPDDDGFYHCRNELLPNPAREVAIRGARQVTYAYIDATPGRSGGARVMEEVEIDRAIFEAFEGAVFMHQGRSYICQEISHDTRIAKMVQADVNFHTRPRDHTDTDAVETHRIRALRGTSSRAYFGKVTITTHVWGYFKVDRRANILDAVDVDCPPFVRHTRGFWIDVPMWLVHTLTDAEINAAAAIHAAEHALLSLTPMFVVSMTGDVRTECKIAEREYMKSKATTRKRPARLIFYDMPGQNSGVCERAFEHLDGLIRIAIAVIEACGCVEGCPGCVTSQICAYANQVTSKMGALGVLRGLIGLEPFEHPLPPQDEEGHAGSHLTSRREALSHTIAEAVPVRVVATQRPQAMTSSNQDQGEDGHAMGTLSTPSGSNATHGVVVEEYDEVLPAQLEESLRRLERAARFGGNSDVFGNTPNDDAAAAGSSTQRPALGKSLLFEE